MSYSSDIEVIVRCLRDAVKNYLDVLDDLNNRDFRTEIGAEHLEPVNEIRLKLTADTVNHKDVVLFDGSFELSLLEFDWECSCGRHFRYRNQEQNTELQCPFCGEELKRRE